MMPTITESRRRVKSYKVLGGDDEDSYAEQQQQEQHAQAEVPQQLRLTVTTCTPEQFPHDVWAAATLCSDQGAAVLQAYEDVRSLRDGYREQLASLTLSEGMGTATRSPAGMHPLLHSGRQLFQPGLTASPQKPTLPPLSKAPTTTAAGVLRDPSGGGMFAGGTQKLFTGNSTFTQAVFVTREQRKLGLFGAQQGVWGQVEQQLAGKTLRPVEDLAMCRGPEHRRKLELVEALQSAKPLQDRPGGPEIWNMSLRNAWERVVPLGSLFSGLTVTVRETPPSTEQGAKRPHEKDAQRRAHERLVQVGRPLEPPPPPTLHRPLSLSVFDDSALLGRSLTRRGRDWASGEILRSRLHQYADAINRQFPYIPDMPSLLVTGQSLAALLETSLRGEVTLDDVKSHLETTNPIGCQELQRVQQQLAEAAERERAQQAEEQATAAEAAAAQLTGLAACRPGINVQASQQSVLLHCVEGQQDMCQVTLTNHGTVALTYTWHRTPTPPHPLATSQSSSAQPTQPVQPFHTLQCHGTLLPGDVARATIVFQPTKAGLFGERWTLETVPALPAGCATVEVEVRGAATRPPAGAPARTALEQSLAHNEKMAKVHAAVEHILHAAGPTPAEPAPEPESSRLACEAWDAANAGAWPPLYYPGDALVQQARDIYTAAHTSLIHAVKPVQPSEPPSGAKKAGGAKGKAQAVAEEEAPAISWPVDWSGSMEDVQGILGELETAEAQRLAAAAAAPAPAAPAGSSPPAAPPGFEPAAGLLQARLARLVGSQAMRVPANGRVLLRHAARAGLGRTADAVDAKLAAVRMDYAQRVAEAEEAVAAAAASGGQAPPAAPSTQWVVDKSKAGAKVQVKNLVTCWWDEVAREKTAVADWIESALLKLDTDTGRAGAPEPQAQASTASVASTGHAAAGGLPEAQAASASVDSTGQRSLEASSNSTAVLQADAGSGIGLVLNDEEYWWARFALLREWSRLGLAPRADIQ